MTRLASAPRHATTAELEVGLGHVAASPAQAGTLTLIVARPGENERAVLERARLDPETGLDGDNWRMRGHSSKREQLTLMNARAIALIAGAREHWPLAGDQLYVDYDLSLANAPPGTRLTIGSALIEISDEPHTGCMKFRERFGRDALKLVNSARYRHLQLRGVNAFIVRGGEIAIGDDVGKQATPNRDNV